MTSRLTNDGCVEVSIEDSGIGFEEKYISKIFKPFYQLQKLPQDEGCGIGLTVCQKIVTRLNGSISVKSSPSKGSTFTVKLPLKPQEDV